MPITQGKNTLAMPRKSHSLRTSFHMPKMKMNDRPFAKRTQVNMSDPVILLKVGEAPGEFKE